MAHLGGVVLVRSERRNRVVLLLIDAELHELDDAVEGEGLGTYVRRVLLRHLPAGGNIRPRVCG